MTVRAVWKFLLSFVIFVGLCYAGLTWFVDREVGKGIDQAVSDAPGLSLAYADLAVSITDHSVTLSDVAATLPDGRSLTADTVVITRYDQMNTVPHHVSASAEGVTMESSYRNFGTWAATLRNLGREAVTGDVDIDYDYNAETGVLTLHRLAVRADSLLDVSLTGSVDQLDLSEARVEKLIGLRLVKAEATITDRALVGEILGDIARRLAISAAQAREQVCAELEAMAEYATSQDNRAARDVMTGIKEFVESPGTLTLTARPEKPVPFLYFYMGRDFYENLQLFNVSATTENN